MKEKKEPFKRISHFDEKRMEEITLLLTETDMVIGVEVVFETPVHVIDFNMNYVTAFKGAAAIRRPSMEALPRGSVLPPDSEAGKPCAGAKRAKT